MSSKRDTECQPLALATSAEKFTDSASNAEPDGLLPFPDPRNSRARPPAAHSSVTERRMRPRTRRIVSTIAMSLRPPSGFGRLESLLAKRLFGQTSALSHCISSDASAASIASG
eukprot:1442098-Pyramimonas_sp.AAC.1